MNKLNAQTQYKNNNKHCTRTETPYKNNEQAPEPWNTEDKIDPYR